ncbi:YbdK family carboxylate-amine ligase [Quisquiliibacterium transsilvanicum]|uniref:Putative glutamate--cysteine ligase 2 n=1 Tax=Quisquiliibacterium transsilvanicum TaxID=1549638 RepID=A0A7W8HJ39_9BURK|nr:YbdK family carboxylate-amine ligase [Quisquiliibacterium transsilvanicum]MBB5273034.1 carboxylate-amine ligase [Quisquiliibacterium transsilvanicum]
MSEEIAGQAPEALEPFAESRALTLGVELELQIVNTHDYDLTSGSADLLRVMKRSRLTADVKPEVTSSMIEMATGICENHADALAQLSGIRDELVAAARKLNVGLSGGGTHPFQQWSERKIFDTPRFHQLSELYGYLTKQFTVFGQHVHVGCSNPDQALWLLHSLSGYIPHFIALSASSPFVQGVDTGFQSARLNSVFAFPLSGRAPFVLTWQGFGEFFGKMTRTGVVKSMKDFYWDIRPKPEFGTIEVRVMDTPLSIEKAAAIAGYIQAVSRWLLEERPVEPVEDDYLVYTFNRFQACRFGFEGTYVDPKTGAHRSLREDILSTIERIRPHAAALGCEAACRQLGEDAAGRGNDATWIRQQYAKELLLPEVVRRQTLRWSGRG